MIWWDTMGSIWSPSLIVIWNIYNSQDGLWKLTNKHNWEPSCTKKTFIHHPSRGMMIFSAHMALMDFKLETQTLGGLDFGRFQTSHRFRSTWFGLYSSRWQEWIWSDLSKMSGGWFGTWILFFPHIGNFIIPTDEPIFFRGVGIPPTRCVQLSGLAEVGTPSYPPLSLHQGQRISFQSTCFFSEHGVLQIYLREIRVSSTIYQHISTIYHRT